MLSYYVLATTFCKVLCVQHPGQGCVIPALGPEIARADVKVKRSYEAAMTALKDRWAARLGDSDLAWAVVCQLVGTIVVARSMASKAAADEVVKANRTQLERVAGKTRNNAQPPGTRRKTQA